MKVWDFLATRAAASDAQRFTLPALAAAGVIGFLGNELAAQVRLRGGRRIRSPALIADGNHARADGFVSLGVVLSAIGVAFGLDLADPIIGFLITLVILKITWGLMACHLDNAAGRSQLGLALLAAPETREPPGQGTALATSVLRDRSR